MICRTLSAPYSSFWPAFVIPPILLLFSLSFLIVYRVFYLASLICIHTTLKCISSFFLVQSSGLVCGHITVGLKVHQLIDIWVISTFLFILHSVGNLTFIYRFLYGPLFSFGEIVNEVACICVVNFVRICQALFCSGCCSLYCHQQCLRVPSLS